MTAVTANGRLREDEIAGGNPSDSRDRWCDESW